ncbi:MAG: hypothetical protein ACLFTK_16355 [Anaerolineales bacterium]
MTVSRFDVYTARSPEDCRAVLADGLEVTRWDGLVRQRIDFTLTPEGRFTGRLGPGRVRGIVQDDAPGARVVGTMHLPPEWPLGLGWLALSVLICGGTIRFGTPTIGIVMFSVIVLLAYGAFYIGMRRKQAARIAGYEIVRVIETSFRA